MSPGAISLSFFDPARHLSGTARAGLTLLFEGRSPTTLPRGPELEATADNGWRARLDERLALEFLPVAPPAELDGASTRLCRVTGTVGRTRIDCFGTATDTKTPPAWSGLDALRAISAVFDAEHAVFAVAERPRGARTHAEEHVAATLLIGDQVEAVAEARISTVYDGEGRQRSAGLELWLPEEDFPRRLSGSVEAGASLTLEGVRVNAAIFRWHMEGREGLGAYELAVRDDREAA